MGARQLCQCAECFAKRSANARLANFVRHSRTDGRDATAAANAGKLGRYMRQVDPDNMLDEPERARRAELALRADMQRLALRSAEKRRARKATT